MTPRFRLGVLGLVVATMVAGTSVHAAETKSAKDIDPAFRKAIVALIDKTGVMNVGKQLYNSIIAQLLPVITKQYGVNSDKIQEVMKDEMSKALDRHIDTFKDMEVAIYATYFTKKDIEVMNAYYDTPTGKKVIASLPQITQESMKAGQFLGRAVGLEAMENVKRRLDAMQSQKSD